MAREHELFREYIYQFNELYPGTVAMTDKQLAVAMQKSITTLRRMGFAIHNGIITKQEAARRLCELDGERKKARAV